MEVKWHYDYYYNNNNNINSFSMMNPKASMALDLRLVALARGFSLENVFLYVA